MTHYDKKYFDWQKQVGVIGGYLNKFKFESQVKDTDVLMDFGCGGGYLLNNFNNAKLNHASRLQYFNICICQEQDIFIMLHLNQVFEIDLLLG